MPNDVKIGALRTRVTLLTPSLVTDAGGAQKPAYAVGDTVWGNVRPASGLELIAAQAAKVEIPITVTIRYRADVTAAWGVSYNGVDYHLTGAPVDIDNRHEHLELKAVVIKGTL